MTKTDIVYVLKRPDGTLVEDCMNESEFALLLDERVFSLVHDRGYLVVKARLVEEEE